MAHFRIRFSAKLYLGVPSLSLISLVSYYKYHHLGIFFFLFSFLLSFFCFLYFFRWAVLRTVIQQSTNFKFCSFWRLLFGDFLGLNGGPRPSIFELELPLSDICWKEKTIFSQYKTVVTVINIDRQSSVKKPTSKNTSSNNTFPIFTLCTTLPISFFLKVGGI